MHWPLKLDITNTNDLIVAIENSIELYQFEPEYNLAFNKYNAIQNKFQLHKKRQLTYINLTKKIEKFEKLLNDYQNDLVKKKKKKNLCKIMILIVNINFCLDIYETNFCFN